MRFERYFEGFKGYMVSKNYAMNTQKAYREVVHYFLRFLNDHYPGVKHISQVTKTVVFDYQQYQHNRRTNQNQPLAIKTINRYLTGLRCFFKYLQMHDYIVKNPTDSLELGREERMKLPKTILSEKEINEILNSITLVTPEDYRDKAIVELLYATGMRTFELLDLRVNDVDFTEQVVIIRKGKGNKARTVPMTLYCVEYLRLYLEKGRNFFVLNDMDDGTLFLTPTGRKFSVKSINRSVMKKIVDKTTITKHITCYVFRHSVATLLINKGVDIRYVAELLGHESLRTTQKYTHLTINDLKKVHSLKHPRDTAHL